MSFLTVPAVDALRQRARAILPPRVVLVLNDRWSAREVTLRFELGSLPFRAAAERELLHEESVGLEAFEAGAPGMLDAVLERGAIAARARLSRVLFRIGRRAPKRLVNEALVRRRRAA